MNAFSIVNNTGAQKTDTADFEIMTRKPKCRHSKVVAARRAVHTRLHFGGKAALCAVSTAGSNVMQAL